MSKKPDTMADDDVEAWQKRCLTGHDWVLGGGASLDNMGVAKDLMKQQAAAASTSTMGDAAMQIPDVRELVHKSSSSSEESTSSDDKESGETGGDGGASGDDTSEKDDKDPEKLFFDKDKRVAAAKRTKKELLEDLRTQCEDTSAKAASVIKEVGEGADAGLYSDEATATISTKTNP